MSNILSYKLNTMPKSDDRNLSLMSMAEVQQARRFHESFPQYKKTPLADLKHMANYLGLSAIKVKDESYRFGLNAFKVLGGSYAIARYIADELQKDINTVDYTFLTSNTCKQEFGQATFFSATDGNHGRGIAWAANQLGQKCVIFMPKGSTQTRLENILKEGATATIEDLNYDDCVRKAAQEAAKVPHGVVVQDTAWEGYEKIPAWIMQGYGTMALEADEDFGEKPTHIFVQAGVGSLAAGMVGYFANKYKDNPGEPNITAWDILKNRVSCFVSLQDEAAAMAMRMLAAPIKGDTPIVSGESGAAGFGALATIMLHEEYQALRQALHLDQNAKVLLFSTEGNTDPDVYRKIVWEGLNH